MPSERVQRRIDDLLDQAEQAVSSRDWAAVDEISLSVLAADPDNEDGKTFLSMAAPHLGNAEKIDSVELPAAELKSTPASEAPASSSPRTRSRHLGPQSRCSGAS